MGFYMGMDLGTDSFGYVATDKDYNVLSFNNKRIMGTRLFDEALTGAERRSFRTGRRRLERRKERIQLLQSLFSEEISKIDFGFFIRLSESKYHLEDKKFKQPNTIFNDKNYNDKDYHKQFPTIYHVRKALIEGKELDVRLVYLAIEHILKHRGHFLFDSIGQNGIVDFDVIFNKLVDYLQNEFEITLECNDTKQLQDILKNNSISKSEKEKTLIKFLNIDKKNNKQLCSIIGLICGCKKSLNDLFSTEVYSDVEEPKICFTESFDDKEDTYRSILNDDFELIDITKSIYDWSILVNILNGEKYISYAKCKTFDIHKHDLKNLKLIIKKHLPEKYDEVFKLDKEYNYVAYSKKNMKNNKKQSITKTCYQDDFCKYIKSLLSNVDNENDPILNDIKSRVENCTFMPKQVSKDNSVIPYQINLFELNKILENASKYLEFLNEVDDSGLSVKDKIVNIFTFRIPYYVGPLNNRSDNSWVVRTNEKIYPWNFDKVVDVDKSAENFIVRMTNKCTYLRKEDVIPKNSLLYSKFSVLNELNNLKINGEKISVEHKQSIYNNLFLKRKKITQKILLNYLKSVGIIPATSKGEEISGIDGDFKSNLSSYIDFRKILETYKNEEMVENIIKSIVLFGDDRMLLKNRIKKEYGNILSKEDIDYVCKLKYKDWGRLSKKFLTELYHIDKSTGEMQNIITLLYNTNNNLMQLLSKNYGFLKLIDAENSLEVKQKLETIIDDLNISPSVKRPVYQTISVLNEVSNALKQKPDKIFVEMTRHEREKKPTNSRKKKLLDLYKQCKKEEASLFQQLQATDENEFKRDKLYLYYTQFGKCMYSGENINIDDLYTTKYDIDHIFPQSKIKDDSLDNRVLVKRESNAIKSNVFPIDDDVQQKMYSFWKLLKDKGLISAKKFERLTRKNELTEDELNDFVARQLVQTSQSTKALCELLKILYPTTDIVYSKAGAVSDFRQNMYKQIIKNPNDSVNKAFFDEIKKETITVDGKDKELYFGYNYDFAKCREVNDFHHAKDAYLNIVVGNVYDEFYTRNKRIFIKDLKANKVSVNRLFDYDKEGVWKAGFNGTIATVKKELANNNILFTRYATEKHGGLFNQTLMKKGLGQAMIKESDERLSIENYGGYNKVAVTYFCYVEHDSKKSRVRTIQPVYLYKKDLYEENPVAYCENVLDLLNPKILVKCIKINTLMKIDGYYLHLSSKTGSNLRCKSAVQLILSAKESAYIKKLSKFAEKYKLSNEKIKANERFDGISAEMNQELYDSLNKKVSSSIFNKRYSNMASVLNENEKFNFISTEQQAIVLLEIIKALHCNSVFGDLTKIGGVKSTGVIDISTNIYPSKKLKEFKLIYQSPSGLFEQEVDLLADNVNPKRRK